MSKIIFLPGVVITWLIYTLAVITEFIVNRKNQKWWDDAYVEYRASLFKEIPFAFPVVVSIAFWYTLFKFLE